MYNTYIWYGRRLNCEDLVDCGFSSFYNRYLSDLKERFIGQTIDVPLVMYGDVLNRIDEGIFVKKYLIYGMAINTKRQSALASKIS